MQVLSKAEIKDLMRDREEVGNYRSRWPSVADKELILAALKAKNDRVELSTGWFSIRYTDGFMYSLGESERHSTAFLKAEYDFVPCGWFDADRLERELLGDMADSEASSAE